MIKRFLSSDQGAPVLSGTAGALISVLDACLVNGYNLKTVNQATYAAGEVTLTLDAGHGFLKGQTVRVSGAVEADYNGDFRATAADLTTVKYAIAGAPTSPATGTIQAKAAPLGWTKPFAGTNLAAYRPAEGLQKYVRIRDDGPVLTGYGVSYRTAQAYLLEDMTGIDTFTPASGYAAFYIRKAQNLTATARPWILAGDGKRFYLNTGWSESFPDVGCLHFAGDIAPWKTDDAWHFMGGGIATLASDSYSPGMYNYMSGDLGEAYTDILSKGMYFLRGIVQTGGMVSAYIATGHNRASTGAGYASFGSNKFVYPGPADNGLYFTPVVAVEVTSDTSRTIRGVMPGLYAPFQRCIQSAFYGCYEGVAINGSARDVLVARLGCPFSSAPSPYSNLGFDLTGPWE